MDAVLGPVLEAAGVQPVLAGLPPGVQAARRGPYLLLLNHVAEFREVRLPSPMVNVVSGAAVASADLGPFGTAILRA
ncbi:MAG: hypothetical protein JOY82_17535 [Streptosporangiaceae bacterium]|nr:hypothetical protein [Streptosporangiaceae bacterium]MBV9856295.1 hypothetical protein [Streptosporangiaceae bacterium]